MADAAVAVRGRHPSDEDGVTLVEVLVAVLLLATAMMALANVATASLVSVRSATDRTTALGLATRAVEASRHVPFEELGLDASAHTGRCPSTFDVDGAGLVEPVLCSALGAVGNGSPFWGEDGPYEVETYVTSISGVPNARRSTAVVTWQEGGTERRVRTSTVIAQVDRD